jgi:hypothetical protein
MAMAVPKLDAPLAAWSANFQVRGSSSPEAFSLSVLQMSQYTALHNSFISAYNAAKADGARSKAQVQAKDDAKAALLGYARELYGLIQASQAVTRENKTLIGVRVRGDAASQVPPPAEAPLLTLISVTGRMARYKLADAQAPNSRRRPPNAEGATLLSYIGAAPPPPGNPGWKLEGQTGKTTFLVEFPTDVAPGTPCWEAAVWYSRRGQYSPMCAPVQTYLQVGPVRMAA